MKNVKFIVLGVLMACAALPAPAAGPRSPVHLTIDRSARISDVLSILSQKTRVPIITDETVINTVEAADIRTPTLEAMLNALKLSDPGFAWQRIYLPLNSPIPTGEAAYREVKALKPGVRSGIITDSPTVNTSISFIKADSSAPIAPPTGMRVAYLVTNEKVRARQLADRTTAEEKKQPPVAKTPMQLALESLDAAAGAFKRLSPTEQQRTLAALRQMLDTVDPAVLNQLYPQQTATAQQPTPEEVEFNRIMNSLSGVTASRRGTVITGGTINSTDLGTAPGYNPPPPTR